MPHVQTSWFIWVICMLIVNFLLEFSFNCIANTIDVLSKSKRWEVLVQVGEAGLHLFILLLNFGFTVITIYILISLYPGKLNINLTSIEASLAVAIIMQFLVNVFVKSPLGELIYALLKTRSLDNYEKLIVMPIIEELRKSNKAYKLPAKINVRIDYEEQVNAYVIGKATIILTGQLINILNKQKIKGILAHEIGHLINNDGYRNISTMGSTYLTFIMLKLISIIFLIVEGLSSELKSLNIICLPLTIIIIIISLICKRITSLLHILVSAFNRRREFLADQFVVSIGLKEELTQALIELEELNGEKTFNYKESHPTLGMRLNAINHGYYNV